MNKDVCLVPTALSEPSVSECRERESEIIRLYRLQTESMKKAIMDIMKSTIGEEI